jgi:hypothetical protein
MVISPGTTDRAHCSLRLRNVCALPGVGSAQSGFPLLAKKETSLRERLVPEKELPKSSLRKGHALREKWTDSM